MRRASREAVSAAGVDATRQFRDSRGSVPALHRGHADENASNHDGDSYSHPELNPLRAEVIRDLAIGIDASLSGEIEWSGVPVSFCRAATGTALSRSGGAMERLWEGPRT